MKSGLYKSSGRTDRPLLFVFPILVLFLINSPFPAHADARHSYQPQVHDSHNSVSRNTDTPTDLLIVAVMVEFQPDSNRFTSGNGTFENGSIPYLESPGTNIDALPHNKEYFEAHLEFTKNYFQTVSNGNLNMNYQVLPNVYRLDKKMEEYSPIGIDPDLSPLAKLAKDTWIQVASDKDISISNPSNQELAFIIFHAGIGRDVELTGTSLDRTPQDIPSAYLSRSALRELLNDPSFSGFEINKGNFLVDHTIILPRTLSRAGEDLSGNPFVLPISLNGLLTAQIGRRLGLPYLFNTDTGRSGIGRFGLMDGAGIFSYNGLFPPEPSAWEKIYMGWAEPIVIPYDHPEPISLKASTSENQGDIAKIPISQSEYYLLENRHRDPTGSGVELTIRKPDGSIVEQVFSNDDIEFVTQTDGFDSQLEPGVIINVSHFDFSLPGGKSTIDVNGQQAEKDLNGGILIWHIDESVIRAGLHSNSINNNPDHRGVQLVEADGAQDIGRPISTGFFQNEINGSPFDFWWAGNTSSVVLQNDTLSLYQNRFGPTTIPDNRSHSGALSHFEIYDFSENLPIASFRIQHIDPFDDLYTLEKSKTIPHLIPYALKKDAYQKRYPLAMVPIVSNSETHILIPGQNGFFIFDLASDFFLFMEYDKPQQPLLLPNNSATFALAEMPSNASERIDLSVFHLLNRELYKASQFEVDSNSGFISMTQPGIIDIDGTTQQIDLHTESIMTQDIPVQRSELVNGHQSFIEQNRLIINFPGGSQSHYLQYQNTHEYRLHTGIIQTGSTDIYVYLLSDGDLTLYHSADQFQIPVSLSDSNFIGWPAFADLNENGNPEIIYVDYDTGHLISKNVRGAMSAGFPISPPSNRVFTGTPLIADINGNGNPEIIIQAIDSNTLNLFAYDKNGEALEEFPLLVGSGDFSETNTIHPLLVDEYLIAVSPEGDLKTWLFPNMQNIQWASGYGSVSNNKVSGKIDLAELTVPLFSLLNRDETYNWPNPATDETNIRFETIHQAQIRITITTLSGRLIYDHTVQARGSMPEEISVDTSGWPSGAYFARVEANDGSRKENKLIKIAIVR